MLSTVHTHTVCGVTLPYRYGIAFYAFFHVCSCTLFLMILQHFQQGLNLHTVLHFCIPNLHFTMRMQNSGRMAQKMENLILEVLFTFCFCTS
jgi:hypothetical protein